MGLWFRFTIQQYDSSQSLQNMPKGNTSKCLKSYFLCRELESFVYYVLKQPQWLNKQNHYDLIKSAVNIQFLFYVVVLDLCCLVGRLLLMTEAHCITVGGKCVINKGYSLVYISLYKKTKTNAKSNSGWEAQSFTLTDCVVVKIYKEHVSLLLNCLHIQLWQLFMVMQCDSYSLNPQYAI